MNQCLLCAQAAEVTPAEWSGGLVTIGCSECGTYQVGNYLIDELDLLRQNASHWIPYLQKALADSGELMKISKVPGYESYRVEPSAIRKLTRLEKKWRRPEKVKTVSGGMIYYSGDADSDDT